MILILALLRAVRSGLAFVPWIESRVASRPWRASIPDACALRLPPGGRLRHPPPRCAWRPSRWADQGRPEVRLGSWIWHPAV